MAEFLDTIDLDCTISKVSDLVSKAKNILFIVGAGISTGLPDFRSAGTGLYDHVEQKYNLFPPEKIFMLGHYYQYPHMLDETLENVKDLVAKAPAGETYSFFKHCQSQNKLFRIYTTNFEDTVRYLYSPNSLSGSLEPDREFVS